MYGQSVFETVAIFNGKACLLDAHLDRLARGCQALSIPLDVDLLTQELAEFIKDTDKAVLRITLSMGSGGRGYLNPQTPDACRMLSLHPYPSHSQRFWEEGVEIGIVDIRLAHQPALAGIKHGNRLEQIIARSQWQQGWQEALVLDQFNKVVEGTQSNVFAVNGQDLLTPSVELAGVAGVVREFVISNAHKLGLTVKTMSLSTDCIKAADEVFLTNSVIGLWPVRKLDSCLYAKNEISHKLLKLMIKNEVIPHYKT